MKRYLFATIAIIAVATVNTSQALAADFNYFKSQSCTELSKELDSLQKAEKAENDAKKSAKDKANAQAVVTTLLIGWPFWGPTDHGDSNNILAEIRADMKMVTRAQKVKKCS